MEYQEFLAQKAQLTSMSGFDPIWMPSFLFDFQQSLVDWSLRKGRSAIFADCGLGKTPMQLVWAENVVRKTNKPVLILTPLAVSAQTVDEAKKFNIEIHRSRTGTAHPGINVTNYEQLSKFSPDDFSGVVCDESSCLKAFDGVRRLEITQFMRKLPYRLLCTATAAPNDYIELGTSSEALGELGYTDMLTRFFKNDQNTIKPMRYTGHGHPRGGGADHTDKWRFKGHAELHFWRWVSSWSRACRRPSDLGFSDKKFILPALIEKDHMVDVDRPPDGMLFSLPAVGLKEQRDERRRSIQDRCKKVASLVSARSDCSMVWCHLNDEGDLLEELIPHAVQVKGSDTDEWKESAIMWFSGNKCICNDPMFRTKLPAWKNLNVRTQNTIAPTIAPIKENGKKAAPQGIGSTQGGDKGTRLIQQNAKEKLKKSKNTVKGIQKLDYSECSSGSELLSNTTEASLPLDALFAAGNQTSILKGSSATTQTTRTIQGNLEDCSVRPAILVSESLEMIQTDLSVPRCICGHISGKRVLISKTVMFGYGLNLQNCSHVTFFPSHSFEQYYQGVRRCWRFGQKKKVHVDIVTTEGEKSVLKNLQRKAAAADKMFTDLIANMQSAVKINRVNNATTKEMVPSWL